VRSFEATTASQSSVAGGDEEDASVGSGDEIRGGRQAQLQWRRLTSRRLVRALGRRKQRWSPLEKASIE
jgi:hypothetical protein